MWTFIADQYRADDEGREPPHPINGIFERRGDHQACGAMAAGDDVFCPNPGTFADYIVPGEERWVSSDGVERAVSVIICG